MYKTLMKFSYAVERDCAVVEIVCNVGIVWIFLGYGWECHIRWLA